MGGSRQLTTKQAKRWLTAGMTVAVASGTFLMITAQASTTQTGQQAAVVTQSTTSQTGQAAKTVTSKATDQEDLSDRFTDPTLLQAVRTGLKLKADQPLTAQAIQSYKGGLDISTAPKFGAAPAEVTSLQGLEVLADLSQTSHVTLNLAIGSSKEAMQKIDFTPLKDLRLGGLTLSSSHFGELPDEQYQRLASLNATEIQNVSLAPQESSVKNLDGMTSHQLGILAPWFAKILDNAYPYSHAIGLAGNSINDFSSLGQIKHISKYGGMITGWYQSYRAQQPATLAADKTVTVKPVLVNIWGETLSGKIAYQNSAGKEAFADQQKLVDPQITDNQIVWGQLGWQEQYVYRTNYTELPDGTPLGGELTFIAGTTVYQDLKTTPDPDPNPNPDPQPTPNPEPTPQPEPTPEPTPVPEPDQSGSGDKIAAKGEAVYAVKKVGLYRKTTFKQANRKIWYAKQPRTKRPQFVVTGYARTKSGTLRYKVRDINHQSKTDGQKGYITANWNYVQNLYYQHKPSRVKVISAKGVNSYRKVNLTGKAKHYRRGAVLKVKAIKRHNLTTRLILTNGQYVTANKTLVIKK